mmetsp:Transcript_3696/g.9550  ORF Transcript_3696/g.9550 Transcript_3696/m.9550 type:complete len:208 (+) Transcript_3696:1256-1879(+)
MRSLRDQRSFLQDRTHIPHVRVGLVVEHLAVVLGELVDHLQCLGVGFLHQASDHDDEVGRAEVLLHGLLVLLHDVRDLHEGRRERLRVRRGFRIDPLGGHQLLEVRRALLRQGSSDELRVLLHALASEPQGMEELGEARHAGGVLGHDGHLELLPHKDAELLLGLGEHADRRVVSSRRQGILRSLESRNILRRKLKVLGLDRLHHVV